MANGNDIDTKPIDSGNNGMSVRIRVNTDLLREAASAVIAFCQVIQEYGSRVSKSLGSLDTEVWSGETRARLNDLFLSVKPKTKETVEIIESLGRSLRRTSDAIEQADRQATDFVGKIRWELVHEPPATMSEGIKIDTKDKGIWAKTPNLVDILMVSLTMSRGGFDKGMLQLGRFANSIFGRGHIKSFGIAGDKLKNYLGVLNKQTKQARYLAGGAAILPAAALEIFLRKDNSGKYQVKSIDDITLDDVGQGATKTGLNYGLASIHPAVATALIANGIVQIAGGTLVGMSKASLPLVTSNKEARVFLNRSSQDLDNTISNLDIENIVSDVSTYIWDVTGHRVINNAKDFWKQPNVDTTTNLALSFIPITSLFDSKAQSDIIKDGDNLALHFGNFGTAAVNAPSTIFKHAYQYGFSIIQNFTDSVPVSSNLGNAVHETCEENMKYLNNLPPLSKSLGELWSLIHG